MQRPRLLSERSAVRRGHVDKSILFFSHVQPPSVKLCRICDVFPDNWNAFVTWECYASKTNLLCSEPTARNTPYGGAILTNRLPVSNQTLRRSSADERQVLWHI